MMKFLRKTNGKLDFGFIVALLLCLIMIIFNIAMALTLSPMPWLSIGCAIFLIYVASIWLISRSFWQEVEEMEQEMEQGVEGFGRDIEELRVWLSKESK